MNFKAMKKDADLMRKFGTIDAKSLLVYAFGITKVALQKAIVNEHDVDQMIFESRKNSEKLWKQ